MREVTHDLRLRELRQAERSFPRERRGDLRLFASADVSPGAPLFVDLDEQRLEPGHSGLHAGVGDHLRAKRHRAVTVSRTPAAMLSIAATSESISASVVISVHWMIRSSRSP